MSDTVPPAFDGLADDYDRQRPRYPARFFAVLAEPLRTVSAPLVVDAGAGTGIALEGLLPALGPAARVRAVDVSADMVAAGRRKFPEVEWTVGGAEEYLERTAEPVALVVAAQAYQWMDRPRFVRAAVAALGPGGALAVMQNNRDHTASAFLDSYEALLEAHSPGYTRGYRSFDVAAELRAGVAPAGGRVQAYTATWTRPMAVDDFVRMAASSTQAQRAVAAEGEEFLDRVRALAAAHASGEEGRVAVAYCSELFCGRLP